MMDTPSAQSPFAPRLPRVIAVGRYRLHRLLRSLITQPDVVSGLQVEVIDLAFEEALIALKTAHAESPIDAVVAGGASGAYLRAHLDIPIAIVEVRSEDWMETLAQARAQSPAVALVTSGEPSQAFARLDALFGMGVAQYAYTDEDSAQRCVQALKAAGIQVVVAPGLVADLAEQAGLKSVFLYSEKSVRGALADARRMAQRAHAHRARSERLRAILAQLQDGVVAVDQHERIEALNPAMARLLGGDIQDMYGRVLGEVAPSLALRETLRRAEPSGDEVVRVGARIVVARRAPILEQGAVAGALVVCRDPEAIQRADRRLRANQGASSAGARHHINDFRGHSAAAQRVRELAQHCAATESTVLITGESGSGKELVAQGVHRASSRASQPFLAINCSALGESLLESELFGYEEGSFTGARRGGKPGLIEAAHTGTLFLDEIGDMPLAHQTRLLRVLQEREVLRIGATQPMPVDIRVIAATHADLWPLVTTGQFRRDLYYRLAVLRVAIPSLRERIDDIAGLAQQFLVLRGPSDKASFEACSRLLAWILLRARSYAWPGNVRELHNLVERLVACHDYVAPRGVLDETRLQALFCEFSETAQTPMMAPVMAGLKATRRSAEWQRVREALTAAHGNQAEACALLGISRATLWRRLKTMKSEEMTS